MKNLITVFCMLVISTALSVTSALAEKKDPRVLIDKMVDSAGSYEKLKSLNDVEYLYTTVNNNTGKSDISTERYMFDGELSWAEYKIHEDNVFPDQEGVVIQGFNGKESWTTLNGKVVDDPQAVKLADFLRKTNFFWFAMMQKLQDPGIIYSYEGKRTVDDTEYDIVKISYEQGIGDVSDTYVLYINPQTHLVDRFLFTVMDFNITDPLIMTVEYEEIEGIKLPVKRKLTQSNWEGEIPNEVWVDEIMSEIKFNNGFKKSDFAKPGSS